MKKTLAISLLSTALFTAGLAVSTNTFAQRYYGANLCGYPQFTCIKVHRGDTWSSLFPNSRDRAVVMRLNRMNMPVQYRSWIVVPKNLRGINILALSPFPLHKQTDGKKLIFVSISSQAFGAYDSSGQLVHWGPISGGKGFCADLGINCTTATGHFQIFRKQGPECISSKFPVETDGGAPMPYCMHFNGGYALHGSTLPGYNASHGCVRLFFEDAQWLNESWAPIGTRVVVTS